MKTKAAEGRLLLPLVAYILRTFFDHGNPPARLRLQCVDALLQCYSAISAWRDDGTPSLAIARHATRHLLLYAELTKQRRSVPWLL